MADTAFTNARRIKSCKRREKAYEEYFTSGHRTCLSEPW